MRHTSACNGSEFILTPAQEVKTAPGVRINSDPRLYRTNQRGQAMVEMAVFLPILLILCVVIVALYRLSNVRFRAHEELWFFANTNRELIYQNRPDNPRYLDGWVFHGEGKGGLSYLMSEKIPKPKPSPRELEPTTRLKARLRQTHPRTPFGSLVARGERHAERELRLRHSRIVRYAHKLKRSPHHYVGSESALATLDRELAKQVMTDPNPYKVLTYEKEFRNRMLDPSAQNSFNLRHSKLKGKSKDFGSAFEGAMANVLQSDDSHEIFASATTYNIKHPPPRGILLGNVIKKVAGSEFDSSLVLLKNTWDTPRYDPKGRFYKMGDQYSTAGSSSDEGQLRKRALGLWIVPTYPGRLVDPLEEIFPKRLTFTLKAIRTAFGKYLPKMKKFIAGDNPLEKVARALHHAKVIGSPDFTLPEFPAVRPDAYPETEELSDKLSGKQRVFKDYLKEQSLRK